MSTTANATDQSLTIRMASSSDRVALTRLAQLDSVAPLGETPALVAEVGGELVAALPLASAGPIANPFRHTAGIVALLKGRAEELKAARQGPRHRGLLRSLRISLAGRA